MGGVVVHISVEITGGNVDNPGMAATPLRLAPVDGVLWDADVEAYLTWCAVEKSLKPSVVLRFRKDLRRASNHWGITRAQSLTPEMARQWINQPCEKGKRRGCEPSASTKINRFVVLSLFYRWLLDERRIMFNPIDGLKVREFRGDEEGARALSEDEISRLFRTRAEAERRGDRRFGPVLRWYLWLYFTQLRYTQAHSVRWGDIRPTTGGDGKPNGAAVTIRASQSKNRRDRKIVIPLFLLNYLGERGQPGDLVFPTSPSNHRLLEDCRRAGVSTDRVSWNSLRKTGITDLAEVLPSLVLVREQSGHRDLRTLERRYVRPRIEKVRAGIEELAAKMEISVAPPLASAEIRGTVTASPLAGRFVNHVHAPSVSDASPTPPGKGFGEVRSDGAFSSDEMRLRGVEPPSRIESDEAGRTRVYLAIVDALRGIAERLDDVPRGPVDPRP